MGVDRLKNAVQNLMCKRADMGLRELDTCQCCPSVDKKTDITRQRAYPQNGTSCFLQPSSQMLDQCWSGWLSQTHQLITPDNQWIGSIL